MAPFSLLSSTWRLKNTTTIKLLNHVGCFNFDGPPVSKPPNRHYQTRSKYYGFRKCRHDSKLNNKS